MGVRLERGHLRVQKGKAAAAVNRALKNSGMTVRELSRRSGVNYQTTLNCIKGKTAMQAGQFLQFAEVLKIDIAGVIYGTID